MNSRIMYIISGVIVLVVGLVLTPTVLSQVNTVVTDPNIGNYPGTSDIAKLIPLVFVVGLLGLAGFLAWRGFKQ